VTLAMAFTKRMPWNHAVPYVGAQLVGALLGGMAIWGVFAHKVSAAGVGQISYGADTAVGSALLNEGIGTAILLFTILGIVDKRGGADLLAGLVIGLIVIGVIITVAPQTGAAINPGRYMGTLITAQFAGLSPDWGQAWVYWVGDVVGGLVGVLAYDLLVKPKALTAAAVRDRATHVDMADKIAEPVA
jgi:glycerol uptake facilitator protein